MIKDALLHDKHVFEGEVVFTPTMAGIDPDAKLVVLPRLSPFTENSRGIGAAEMADAIAHGRKSRLDHWFAYHVFEALCAIHSCGEGGGSRTVTFSCEMPESFFEDPDWAGMIG